MISWADKSSGIYGIYCQPDKKWYVGQAQNIRRRNQAERRALAAGTCHNKHLQRAWDKYGPDAFLWVVLAYCPTEALDATEIAWIEKLNSYKAGFNETVGGGGARGFKHSKEWRDQASARNSDGKSPRKGHPIPAASKARMRANALGGNSPRAKAVYQMNGAGEVLALFDSVSNAARATGVTGAHISEVCRGTAKRRTAGGFIWRYVGGGA